MPLIYSGFEIPWRGIALLAALACAGSCIKKCHALVWAFRAARACPGSHIQILNPFRPLSLIFGLVFPPSTPVTYYKTKFAPYAKAGSTCISAVPLTSGRPYFWLADADAICAVAADRATFQKDVEAYEAINIFGFNLVSAEGSVWKRHRAVAKPAFSEANVSLAWSEASRVIHEWFAVLDHDADGNDTPVRLVDAMLQATLLAVMAAGELLPLRVTFSDGARRLLTRVRVPWLARKLEETWAAFGELEAYMLEMVRDAREKERGEMDGDRDTARWTRASGADLLSNLTEASLEGERGGEGSLHCLSDDELLSNMFVFFLAGHETSAHSLTFAFVLLALYPDVQQKLFAEVAQLWPQTDDAPQDYATCFPRLPYTLATFREALRLFPVVPLIAKPAHAAAVLHATRTADGKRYAVPVPRGSVVVLDIYATHMNPLYWGADAETFRPERFVDTPDYRWPRDAFLAFSAGARGCIGQRYALAESVCILARVVRRYEVLLPAECRGMTREAAGERLLRWKAGVTLTPLQARVRLRRREA